MSKFFRLGVRSKVLIFILLIILVSLGTFLYFAVDLFTKDKNAYIYETGLSVTESIGEQIHKSINIYLINSYSNALIGSTDEAFLQNIVNTNKDLLLFLSYKKIGKNEYRPKLKIVNKNVNKKFGLQQETIISVISKLNLYQKEELKAKNSFIYNTTKDIGHPSLAIILYSKKSDEYYVNVISLEEMLSKYDSRQVFKIMVYDNDLSMYYASKGIANSDKFNIILKNNILSGTQEYKVSQTEKYLVSYKKIPAINIGVMTAVSSEKAFLAQKKLIQKTVLIGVLLLLISIFVGMIFSKTFTDPILNLVKGAEYISSGNYGQKVELKNRDELNDLANSFNIMSLEIAKKIHLLENANVKLEDYSQNLEKMVAQRTEELRQANLSLDTMINSIGQGLFVFNQDCSIDPIYTNACEEHCVESPKGNLAFKVLGIESESEIETFKKWNKNLFTELLPFKDIARLGPKSLPSTSNIEDLDFKHIGLEFHPIRNEVKKVSKVVAVTTDKTAEVVAKELFDKKEKEVNKILLLVKNKKHFFSFLKEFQEMILEFNEIVQSGDTHKKLGHTLALLHSMKGGASLFSLHELSLLIHKIEDKFFEFKERSMTDDELVLFKDSYKQIKESFEKEVTAIKDFLGSEASDGKHRITFIEEDLISFKDFIKVNKIDSIINEFNERFLNEPIEDFFKGYNRYVQEVSSSLGKEIAPIIFINGSLRINHNKFRKLINVLVHIFRNSVDHGIEFPSDREAQGKNRQGIIRVKFSKKMINNNDNLIIEIQDDGPGINTEKLIEVAKNKGAPELVEGKTEAEINLMIFHSKISTSKSTTELSGRGVGMSAVKEVVDEMGGRIVVKSLKGTGTSIGIILPI